MAKSVGLFCIVSNRSWLTNFHQV